MEEIINKIIIELNRQSKKMIRYKNYKIATELIKNTFAKKGRELDYCIAAHRNLCCDEKDKFEYDEGEWLFDLVWYKMSSKDNQIMESIPLVLESELSNHSLAGLKVDFDKLLVASSSTKVFVTTNEYIEFKKDYIKRALKSFINFREDEIFYLIIWDERYTGNFILEKFTK